MTTAVVVLVSGVYVACILAFGLVMPYVMFLGLRSIYYAVLCVHYRKPQVLFAAIAASREMIYDHPELLSWKGKRARILLLRINQKLCRMVLLIGALSVGLIVSWEILQSDLLQGFLKP